MPNVTVIAYSNVAIPTGLDYTLAGIDGPYNYQIIDFKSGKTSVDTISLSESFLRHQYPVLIFNLYSTIEDTKTENARYVQQFVEILDSNAIYYLNYISADFDDVKLIARNDLVNNVPMIKVRDNNPDDLIDFIAKRGDIGTKILKVKTKDASIHEISKL